MRLISKSKHANIRVTTMEAELDFVIKDCTTGKRLFDQVTRTIGLREIWFFGLLYHNNQDEEMWLNLNKKISSIDIKKTTPLLFEFRAKFYPEDAKNEFIQEVTSRLFFLQVKEDILSNRLSCPPETAVLLASYACQAKYGDYDERHMNSGTISLDRLLPHSITGQHDLQRDDWFEMMSRWYREHKGMDSQTAILSYLELAQDLEAYGVEFFEILNKRQTKLILGIDAFGLVVYKPPDTTCARVGFPWSEIRNIAFNDKKFTIKPVDKKSPEFVFFTTNLRSNKQIMALCVGNNELYIRRRKPASIEEQQMRNQAQKDNLTKQIERKRLEKEISARMVAEQKVRDLEARLHLATEIMSEGNEEDETELSPSFLPKVFITRNASDDMKFKKLNGCHDDAMNGCPTVPSQLTSVRSLVSPTAFSQYNHEPLIDGNRNVCIVSSNQLQPGRSLVSPQFFNGMKKQENDERSLMSPNQLTDRSASVLTIISTQVAHESNDQENEECPPISANRLISVRPLISPGVSSQYAHEAVINDAEVIASPIKVSSMRSPISPQNVSKIVKKHVSDDALCFEPVQQASVRSSVSLEVSTQRLVHPKAVTDKAAVWSVHEDVIQSIQLTNATENYEKLSAGDNLTFSFSPDTPTCSSSMDLNESAFRESPLLAATNSLPLNIDNDVVFKPQVAPPEQEIFINESQGSSLSSDLSNSLHEQNLPVSSVKKWLDESVLLASSTGQRVLRDSSVVDEGKSLPFETPSSSIFPVCVPKLNQPMVGDNYITCLALSQPLQNNASSSKSRIRVSLSSLTSSTIDSSISMRPTDSKTVVCNTPDISNKPRKENKSNGAAVQPISSEVYSRLCGSCKPQCSQLQACPPSQPRVRCKNMQACQERLLAESRRTRLTRLEAEQIRAREREKLLNRDQRPPFDNYRQPPEDRGVYAFETWMKVDEKYKRSSVMKQTTNSNMALNGMIMFSPDSSVDSDDHSPNVLSSPLSSQNVDFPLTLVPCQRSEELRQSTVRKDTSLQAKLAHLRDRLRAKQKMAPSPCLSMIGKDDETVVETGDKFDTLRMIRLGNTKRRIDEFEAL